MKKILLTLLVFTQSYALGANITISDALAQPADASNYHTTNQAGAGVSNRVLIKTNGGTVLNTAAAATATTKYWLGYYVGGSVPTTGPDFVGSINDQSRFIPLGYGTSGLGSNISALQQIGAVNGRLANTMTSVTYLDGTANALATGGINRGTRLYMILLNQADTVVGLSTELGVFSATNWTVPATGTANMLLGLKDVDTNGEVFYGSLGSLNLNAVIPEPSVSGMALLAGFGLISRRRR